MNNQAVFSLNMADIQFVALETIDRILSTKEINLIKSCIGENVPWYKIIEALINELVLHKSSVVSYNEKLGGFSIRPGKEVLLNWLIEENPYLLKSKDLRLVPDIVKSLLLIQYNSLIEKSVNELCIQYAFSYNKKAFGGIKSKLSGIDMEFNKGGFRYIVVIRNHPHWGNDAQIKKMISDFNLAKKVLRSKNPNINVISVNGCCYGRDANPDKKGIYFKYCGQRFWEFISGDPELYKTIIEPLGHKAKEKNEAFLEAYPKVLNKFILEFIQEYCLPDGSINWPKIVELNCGMNIPKKDRKRNPRKSA